MENLEIKITLQTIQKIFLQRFKELIDFLNNNNIRYFAVAGTALGAVRHNGFIPWDNDIDIGMLREDYEKFLTIAHSLNHHHFFVYSARMHKQKHVNHGLTKISIIGTQNVTNEKLIYDHSLHIDIFPYDRITTNGLSFKWVSFRRSLFRKCLYIKSKRYSSKFFKKIALFMLKALLSPFSSSWISRRFDAFARKIDKKYRQSEYVATLMGVYPLKREVVPIDCIGLTQKTTFNSINISIPEKPDVFLKRVYGDDYLIPSNKRLDEESYFAFATKKLLDEIFETNNDIKI